MSAGGIKISTATTTTHIANHNAAAAADDDEDVCINTNNIDIQQSNNCVTLYNEENSTAFNHLPSLREQSSPGDDYEDGVALLHQHKSLENSSNKQHEEHEAAEDEERSRTEQQYSDNHHEDDSQLSPGLSLLQQAAASSPPPHSYRHSRAYRHFKNPPQPHMCIRTTSESSGEELFINVLSWTRIVIPQEPSDPIPLYGGMRVPPGNPRSPPIVFAVMANPEVLKDSGRHSKDPEERRAMVELMCDFVEAMNPGVKLIRNAVILKDRDISGELKDVWNAVQAQRDREREEQILQQRQQQHQQHYHNLTNASLSGGGGLNTNAPPQQMFPKSILGSGGVMLVSGGEDGTPPRTRKYMQELQLDNRTSHNADVDELDITTATTNTAISLSLLAEQLDNNMLKQGHEEEVDEKVLTNSSLTLSNGNELKDSVDTVVKRPEVVSSNQLNANSHTTDQPIKQALKNGGLANANSNGAATTEVGLKEPITSSLNNSISSTTTTASSVNTQQNPITTTTPSPAPPPATKKDKLAGFLPNGCIFPRFTKNSKHKDKDKEGKTKEKEKNVLLNALKKSKDKKSNAAAAIAAAAAAAKASANQDDIQQQQQEQNINNFTTTTSPPLTATTTNATNNKQQQQQQKNCLQQLECGVQKLDLNRIDNNAATTNTANNKTTTTAANNTTTNTSGVGVH